MKLSGVLGLRPATVKYISTGMAALGALAISAQADAADIYAPVGGGFKDVPVIAPPPPMWTGFYAGINMGAAWSQLDINRIYEPNGTGGFYPCPVSGAATWGYCFGGNDINSTNAFGGGQLGYNWQGWGNFVFGIEVDLLGVAGNNERSFFGRTNLATNLLPPGTPIVATFKQDGGFAGDVTGRLGYAWGNWMLYAKGGFAWFDPDISVRATAFDKQGLPLATLRGWNDDSTLTGWTVGGGVEWLLNPNWSVKLEYMYYNFDLDNDTWNATWCRVGQPCTATTTYANWKVFDNELTVNTVKLGVNYHLTSGYVPLK